MSSPGSVFNEHQKYLLIPKTLTAKNIKIFPLFGKRVFDYNIN